jgi:signal transduction histidine kinase
MLDTADLEAALRQMIAQVSPDPRYARVRIEGTARTIGSTVEHHLLRIAQEAITNAIKHAGAPHLEITLAFRERDVQLTIADDGRGFDLEATQLQGQSHFGLPGLRGRARTIGAKLEITSRPGAGTSITVRVPLAASPAPEPSPLEEASRL